MAGAAAWGLLGPLRRKGLCVAILIVGYLISGHAVLAGRPAPSVDVVAFQQDACAALIQGRSPYSITFVDLAPPGTHFYADGLSRDGRLLFGFPYPPLSLLAILPAYLAGNFRWAGLIAMAIAGGFVALLSPGRRSFAAAVLLLTTPMGFFVVWAGWTEPLGVMLLTGVALAATRMRADAFAAGPESILQGDAPLPSRALHHVTWKRTIALTTALGLLLAIKQYMIILLPLLILLAPPGRRWRTAMSALALAAAITLPWVLADASGFVHSVVTLQLHQPFRPDALSLLAPLAGRLPAWAATAIPLAITVGTLLWLRRVVSPTPAGVMLGVAVLLLVFFATNKQAFCNYYHLALGAMCCALGASTKWGSSPLDASNSEQSHSHAGA